jgi:hypothetical protein
MRNAEPGAFWANKGTGTENQGPCTAAPLSPPYPENRESTTIHPLTRSPVHPFTLSGEERHR